MKVLRQHSENKSCIAEVNDHLDVMCNIISNGNGTEWSTIQGVIGRVTLLEITSTITSE